MDHIPLLGHGLVLDLFQEDPDQMGKAQVNDAQIESHQKNGDQDHGGGSDGLFPGRPSHLLQFHPYFPEKLFGFLQKFPDLLHFLFPELKFTFLAGQEGFEPPSPGFGVRCSSR
jgi:hypothetical protein